MLNLILDHFLHQSQSNEHSRLLNQSDALLLYHLDLSNDHGHIGLFIRPIRTVKIKKYFSISRSERLCDDTLTMEIFKDIDETKEKGISLLFLFQRTSLT